MKNIVHLEQAVKFKINNGDNWMQKMAVVIVVIALWAKGQRVRDL